LVCIAWPLLLLHLLGWYRLLLPLLQLLLPWLLLQLLLWISLPLLLLLVLLLRRSQVLLGGLLLLLISYSLHSRQPYKQEKQQQCQCSGSLVRCGVWQVVV
jgi:hypothetical protein